MNNDLLLGAADLGETLVDARHLDRLNCILSRLALIDPTTTQLAEADPIKTAMEHPNRWDEPLAWRYHLSPGQAEIVLSLPWKLSPSRVETGLLIRLDLTKPDFRPRIIARRRENKWSAVDDALAHSDWHRVVSHYASDADVKAWAYEQSDFALAVLEKLRHAGLHMREANVDRVPRPWPYYGQAEEVWGRGAHIGQVIHTDGRVLPIVRTRDRILVVDNRRVKYYRWTSLGPLRLVIDKNTMQVIHSLSQMDELYTPPLHQKTV